MGQMQRRGREAVAGVSEGVGGLVSVRGGLDLWCGLCPPSAVVAGSRPSPSLCPAPPVTLQLQRVVLQRLHLSFLFILLLVTGHGKDLKEAE